MTPTRLKTPFCHSLHVITCQQQGNRLRASENKNINEHEWENWQESKKGIWEREVCSDILPSVVCWEAVHCSTDIKAHASCLSPNPLPWCPSIRFVAYMSTHIHTASPHTSEKLQMCVCVCRGISANRLLYSPPAGEQTVCKSSARLFVLKSPYRGHCLCLLCSVGEDIPLAASLLQLWQSSAISLESL